MKEQGYGGTDIGTRDGGTRGYRNPREEGNRDTYTDLGIQGYLSLSIKKNLD